MYVLEQNILEHCTYIIYKYVNMYFVSLFKNYFTNGIQNPNFSDL